MSQKKNNFRRKSTQLGVASSSFADLLGADARRRLQDLGHNNVKNMVREARQNPTVLKAEEKFSK